MWSAAAAAPTVARRAAEPVVPVARTLGTGTRLVARLRADAEAHPADRCVVVELQDVQDQHSRADRLDAFGHEAHVQRVQLTRFERQRAADKGVGLEDLERVRRQPREAGGLRVVQPAGELWGHAHDDAAPVEHRW